MSSTVLRLSAEAWVMLRALQRQRQTGRAAPTGWYHVYAELMARGLAEHVGLKCIITPAGERALRARAFQDGSVGLAGELLSSIVRRSS